MHLTRKATFAFGIVCAIAAFPAVGQETIDPEGDGSQYAWAENVGWINAEPGGDGGSGMEGNFPEAAGWLWGENIGWISLTCANTSSCGTAQYGVEVSSSGDLSGWAWGENIGWISFSCANTLSCATVDYGVSIDLATGDLSGYAWSENLGWFSFSCDNTASCGSVAWKVRTTVPLPGSEIFSDDFETGTTGEWSSVR